MTKERVCAWLEDLISYRRIGNQLKYLDGDIKTCFCTAMGIESGRRIHIDGEKAAAIAELIGVDYTVSCRHTDLYEKEISFEYNGYVFFGLMD